MKTLIVYYSRTGTTRRVAEELKTMLSADLDEIKDHKGRGGPLGFLQSGMEAKSSATPKIDDPTVDPSGYDLVVVGTPVWANCMSSPVRTYLTQEKGKLRRVAFLCTSGDASEQAFAGMEELAGKPTAKLKLTAKDMSSGGYKAMLQVFSDSLKSA